MDLSSLRQPKVNPGPLYMVLGAPMTPSNFWASELPVCHRDIRSQDHSVSPAPPVRNSDYNRVMKLEQKLAEKYNNEKEIRLQGEGHIRPEDLKEGMMVAFRNKTKSRFWYRGRIESLYSKLDSGTFARIFMVDYGKYVEPVVVRTDVRTLPRAMKSIPKPRAVQLVLAGVRPISYDATSSTANPQWSEKTMSMILSVLKLSPNRMVEVFNWAEDAEGKIHGKVRVQTVNQGLRKKVFLDEVLLANQCAIQSDELFMEDLKPKPIKTSRPVYTNLSICGGDSAAGGHSFSTSRGFNDIQDFEASFENPKNDNDTTFGTQLVAETRFIGPKPWMSIKSERVERANTTNSSSGIIRPESESDDPNSSIWDEFRSTMSDNESRKETHTSRNKAMYIPGGVDLGKFLEEQLKRVKSPPVGPKMIINLPELREGKEDENEALEKMGYTWQNKGY